MRFERREKNRVEAEYSAVGENNKVLSKMVVRENFRYGLETCIRTVRNEGGRGGARSLIQLHEFVEETARNAGMPKLVTHATPRVAAFFARRGYYLPREPYLPKKELLARIATRKKEPARRKTFLMEKSLE